MLQTVHPDAKVFSIVHAPSIKKHYLLCEYLSQWHYKDLYLFTGYVSSARVVDRLFIIRCILRARETKMGCQFTRDEPRGTKRIAGPLATPSLFTPSVLGIPHMATLTRASKNCTKVTEDQGNLYSKRPLSYLRIQRDRENFFMSFGQWFEGEGLPNCMLMVWYFKQLIVHTIWRNLVINP